MLPFVGFAPARRRRPARGRPDAAPPALACRVRAGRGLLRRLGVFAPARTLAAVVRAPFRARRAGRVDDEMARQVAVAVDLVGVGVAAGHTPYLAVQPRRAVVAAARRARARCCRARVRDRSVVRRHAPRPRPPCAERTRAHRDVAHERRVSDRRPHLRSRASRPRCAPISAAAPKPGPARCRSGSASRSWAASCPPSRCSPSSRPSSPASRAERSAPAFPASISARRFVRVSTLEVERVAIAVQSRAFVARTY